MVVGFEHLERIKWNFEELEENENLTDAEKEEIKEELLDDIKAMKEYILSFESSYNEIFNEDEEFLI